jgi:hypothetical protein
MQSRTLLNLALTLSLCGAVALPAVAEPTVMVKAQSGVTIPQTAGIVISLPGNLTVDVGQKQDYPLTVPLVQPLFDTAGNEVVAANSPVVIKLKPEDRGARIVAEAIVVRGQIVPIQAMTAVIPGNTITQAEGAEVARQNSAVYGNLFGSVMGAAAPTARKADAFDQGGMIGGAIGILSGLGSPKNVRVVQLPQGSVYVLTLQAPVVLPTLAIAPKPTDSAQSSQSSQASPSSQASQFDFKTLLDYSKGLETVIAAYQNGQISQDDARRVIVAADAYAASLSPKLYPPAGLRNRIYEMFKFSYAIATK